MYILYQNSIFDDIALIFSKLLGFYITVDVIDENKYHLILGIADIDFNGKIPKIFDVIQFEQKSSKWFSLEEHIDNLKKARYVFDFSNINHNDIKKYGI